MVPKRITLVIESRELLSRGLSARGFTVCPSQANFVFAEHRSRSGRALFDGLESQGILVRRWDKPRIDNHLRITVGKAEEMERVLATLDSLS